MTLLDSSKAEKLIVVVSNSVVDQKILLRLFEINKYRVISTATAPIALEWLDQHRFIPNLIIVDMSLSGMGDTQTILELKAHSLTKNVPILALIMQQSEGDTAIKLGSADYLIKQPLHQQILLEKVQFLSA